jgi:hypothetical protein
MRRSFGERRLQLPTFCSDLNASRLTDFSLIVFVIKLSEDEATERVFFNKATTGATAVAPFFYLAS